MAKPRPKKQSTKKATEVAAATDLSRAILLVRWSRGNDVLEIGTAVAAFKADTQIATYDAKDSHVDYVVWYRPFIEFFSKCLP